MLHRTQRLTVLKYGRIAFAATLLHTRPVSKNAFPSHPLYPDIASSILPLFPAALDGSTTQGRQWNDGRGRGRLKPIRSYSIYARCCVRNLGSANSSLGLEQGLVALCIRMSVILTIYQHRTHPCYDSSSIRFLHSLYTKSLSS